MGFVSVGQLVIVGEDADRFLANIQPYLVGDKYPQLEVARTWWKEANERYCSCGNPQRAHREERSQAQIIFDQAAYERVATTKENVK